MSVVEKYDNKLFSKKTVNQKALKKIVLTSKPAALVAEHVLERVPDIFKDDWSAYRHWRSELGSRIGVDPCNICLTGSAAVGYSFSPGKNLKQFSDTSDVDVGIISDYYFTLAWRTLRAIKPGLAKTKKLRTAIQTHRTEYIFAGCIATDRILAILPFAKSWVIARSDMMGVPPTEGREVNFRIYRDYESLRDYQIKSVSALRTALENIK